MFKHEDLEVFGFKLIHMSDCHQLESVVVARRNVKWVKMYIK